MSLSGTDVARHDRCKREFGVSFVELCTLVFLVARHRAGYYRTTRLTIDAFLQQEEGFTVNGSLRQLERLALVREVGRLGGAVQWAPTATGIAKVEWAGRDEQRREGGEAAAE